jgi:DNA-binding CsgD family transcriptional regulator
MKKRLRLTQAEAEILASIADGLSVADIAVERECSPNTVRTHLQNMLRANDLHSRAHLVARAYEEGILRPRRRRG